MKLKPSSWYWVTLGLAIINLVGAGAAIQAAEPWHATAHGVLALLFGMWAQRLREGSAGGPLQSRLEALEADMQAVRQELGEAQERLDFAERVLAQHRESRRVGPEGDHP